MTAQPPGSGIDDFIRQNLRLAPIPLLPDIRLYTAHSGSGLRRYLEGQGEACPPYWAYAWAGGLALARHIAAQPETVRGRSVLDFGAGSGLVAIAAARAGAREVAAAETDSHACAALRLNAAANGVAIELTGGDITEGPPPAVDLILAGDVFYDPVLAERVTLFFDRCFAAGVEVLVGDIGRAHLPRSRLELIAQYPVPDFGDAGSTKAGIAGVFSFAVSRSMGLARK